MSTSVESFEVIFVSIVLVIQLIVFLHTIANISKLRRLIPKKDSLSIQTERLINSDNITEDVVHEDLSDFTKNVIGTNKEEVGSTIISFGDSPFWSRSTLKSDINQYLSGVTKANLSYDVIKDIIDRNGQKKESEISSTVGIPLYIGLMGTMLGIVIALFFMPDLSIIGTVGTDFSGTSVDSELNNSITILIGGVKIAMIASFMGLFFTVLGSGLFYKRAKSLYDQRRNELLTFIQIELIPQIDTGLAGTFESLQRNLFQFNLEFTSNLSSLSTIFDRNADVIRDQKELLKALDESKIATMSSFNIQVLKELKDTVGSLQAINNYVANLQQTLTNSNHIIANTERLIERTSNVDSIAADIKKSIEDNRKVISFIQDNFDKLEEHKQMTHAKVAEVGFAIIDVFDELKNQFGKQTTEFKQFAVDEVDALRSAMRDSKTNLGNLEYLSKIDTRLDDMMSKSNKQTENLNEAVKELSNQLVIINQNIVKQNQDMRKNPITKLWIWLFDRG